MKAGWKNDPVWRMYVEQKKLVNNMHRMQRLHSDAQMEALAADAEVILVRLQEEATKTPGTRH